MKMLTGAVDGNQAGIIKYLPLTTETKLRMVVIWSLTAAASATPGHIEFQLQYRNGITAKTARVRYLNSAATVSQDKWQYWTTAPAWADITGADEVTQIHSSDIYWQYFDMTADFSGTNASIDEFITNKHNMAALSLECNTPAVSDQYHLVPYILCETDAASATTAWIAYVGVFAVD
jgi:hypothetical protein